MGDSDQELRIGTPVFGVEILKDAKNTGIAQPVEPEKTIAMSVAADAMNVVATRAAEKAVEKVMNGNGNGKKKKEVGEWVRWGAGLAILLGGLLWGGAELFAERPTGHQVKEMIQSAKSQHPDSKEGIKANAMMNNTQEIEIGELKVTVKSIDDSLKEIKKDLKDLNRRGR
jgi:hypothetical protein